jgi:hypothetical protein
MGTAGKRRAKTGKATPPIPAGLKQRRAAKTGVLARLREDTATVNGLDLLTSLRKQGYEELDLEEIQDRLTRLRSSLGEGLVSRRQ